MADTVTPEPHQGAHDAPPTPETGLDAQPDRAPMRPTTDPPPGPVSRRAQIVAAAERLLESEGPSALTMRRLAAEVGIRAPSLYKHVAGKADIEGALQERALLRLGQALSEAGPDVVALAAAYRAWALTHPGPYELVTRRELRRDRLRPGVEDAPVAPFVAAAGGDEHLGRSLWALAHGMVELERAGRFAPDADVERIWATALWVLTGRG